MQNNRAVGAKGEQTAWDFLQQKGFSLLAKNFSCALGEIDLIAKDKQYVVFIEVKFRSGTAYGYPREAVSKAKQKTIRQVAMFYIQKNNLTNRDFRFDVVEILNDEINHLVNAF